MRIGSLPYRPLRGVPHNAVIRSRPSIGKTSNIPTDPAHYLGKAGVEALCDIDPPDVLSIASHLKSRHLTLQRARPLVQQQIATGIAEWVFIDHQTLDRLNVCESALNECRIWNPVKAASSHANTILNALSFAMSLCEQFLNPRYRSSDYGLAIEISVPAQRRRTAGSFTKAEFRDLFSLLLIGDPERYNRALTAAQLPPRPVTPIDPELLRAFNREIDAILAMMPEYLDHRTLVELSHQLMKKDVAAPVVFSGGPIRLLFLPLAIEADLQATHYLLCALPLTAGEKSTWGAGCEVEEDLGAMASVRIRKAHGQTNLFEHGHAAYSSPLLEVAKILVNSMGWKR